MSKIMALHVSKECALKAAAYVRKTRTLHTHQFFSLIAKYLSVLIHASLTLSLTTQYDLKLQNDTSKRSLSIAISMSHKYPKEFKTAKHYKNYTFVMRCNRLKLTCTVQQCLWPSTILFSHSCQSAVTEDMFASLFGSLEILMTSAGRNEQI